MEQAASTLWQGFTAHAFACTSYPIKAGDKILVHAAAGGVGGLIVQIAKNAGNFYARLQNSLFFSRFTLSVILGCVAQDIPQAQSCQILFRLLYCVL